MPAPLVGSGFQRPHFSTGGSARFTSEGSTALAIREIREILVAVAAVLVVLLPAAPLAAQVTAAEYGEVREEVVSHAIEWFDEHLTE